MDEQREIDRTKEMDDNPWRTASNEELKVAAVTLRDYSELSQQLIVSEMRRRGMTVRDGLILTQRPNGGSAGAVTRTQERSVTESLREYYFAGSQDSANRIILTHERFVIIRKGRTTSYPLNDISSVRIKITHPNKLLVLVAIVGCIGGLGLMTKDPVGIIFLIGAIVTFAKAGGKIEMEVWLRGDEYCKYENRYVLRRKYEDAQPFPVDHKLEQFILTVNARLTG